MVLLKGKVALVTGATLPLDGGQAYWGGRHTAGANHS